MIEYRMCVHVFGNSPSPAIATFGLRHAAKCAEPTYGSDMKTFVDRDFYVDDGLTSLPNVQMAIDLMQRTQSALRKHGNLRLHKIASNSSEMMAAFPSEALDVNLELSLRMTLLKYREA